MVDIAALEGARLFTQRPEPVADQAHFYHTMDLPGHGTVNGAWDLRAGLDQYLGRVDYAGRTVLEIGPATGFVTFAMERRGATVVAVDLPLGAHVDMFPAPDAAMVNVARSEVKLQSRRDGFWMAHKAFDSRARLIECSVDNLDPRVTGFDVAIICNVMQHRSDPVGMLLNIADRAQTMVVTEADWHDGVHDDKPVMQLVTDAIRAGKLFSWFILSPKLVEDVLSLKGFEIVGRDIHHQPFTPGDTPPALVRHYTITATKITP